MILKNQIIISMIMLAMASGCVAQTPLTESIQVVNKNHDSIQWIKKDANLFRVDDKLYRSEQLIAEDKQAILDANIKSMINLRFFKRHSDAKVFADNPSIQLINLPLLTWRIRATDLARALFLIEQNQKHGAVLVHCYHGADRTGIVIAMYRIIQQNWTIEQAKQEMQEGGFGYHSIWKNLDKLLNQNTVQEVREHLSQLRQQSLLSQAQ